jgi:hypothetical protein
MNLCKVFFKNVLASAFHMVLPFAEGKGLASGLTSEYR